MQPEVAAPTYHITVRPEYIPIVKMHFCISTITEIIIQILNHYRTAKTKAEYESWQQQLNIYETYLIAFFKEFPACTDTYMKTLHTLYRDKLVTSFLPQKIVSPTHEQLSFITLLYFGQIVSSESVSLKKTNKRVRRTKMND